ncbi:phosphoribosylamine--glycine ligase [bacterium]|nr:phosphoribosylamine--glycine ligase [bacterium]
MKVLVIGSGGREHTLVWKLSKSKNVSKIYCIPGNGGISQMAECSNIDMFNFPEIANFAKSKGVDLTIVGPEAPLSEGIVDFFQEQDLKIFGPNKEATRLESSKVFAKIFMKKYNIPTAEFEIFDNSKDALKYVDGKTSCVVKADGLAAGKGVMVCHTKDQARDAITSIMEKGSFGDAGNQIVIDELLVGEEASLMAFCDGKSITPMIPSQDHKPIFDNDKGPNTGGMGAYAPAPVVTDQIYKKAQEEIFDNFLFGLKKEGIEFKGIIYAGIMITEEGLKVLEFNVRFGDPELQVVLPLLKGDLIDIITRILRGRLKKAKIEWEDKSCVCVVMASGGYPGKYEKGKEIMGLEKIKGVEDVVVYHAGTEAKNGKVLTAGGRVLGVAALGGDLKTSIDKAYEATQEIKFDNMYYRKDIGAKGLKKR